MQLLIVLGALVAATLAAPTVVSPALPPCGLPPFFDELPDRARDAIGKIWASYVDGEECINEHAEMKQILDTLPPPPPPPAAPAPPPCGAPKMIDMLPEETRVGLQKIWEGYVDGEDCTARQEQMQAFLDVMNRKMMEKFNIPMPPPPCALPPFTDKLPMDAKQEVEAIWSQYEEGSDCSKQHELTKAVIDALPQEVKESILPPGPPPMPPTTNPNEPAPVGPPPPRVLPKPDTSAPNVPPPLPLKQY